MAKKTPWDGETCLARASADLKDLRILCPALPVPKLYDLEEMRECQHSSWRHSLLQSRKVEAGDMASPPAGRSEVTPSDL